ARRALPPVGATVPLSIPTVVDLPAPLGPSRPNISPGATSKSTALTASTPPGYVLLSPRASMAGRALAASLRPPRASEFRFRLITPPWRRGRHLGRVSFVTAMTDPNRRR